MHGLRRGYRSIRIAHLRGCDHAALQDHRRLHAEERRLPQHQISDFAGFDRSDDMRNAMRDRRVDRVFGDIALCAEIIISLAVFWQSAALHLHFVRSLPGSHDDFADASHRLRIRGHHRNGAQIVQDIFGGNRLSADTGFGESDIFGDRRIEMMADH